MPSTRMLNRRNKLGCSSLLGNKERLYRLCSILFHLFQVSTSKTTSIFHYSHSLELILEMISYLCILCNNTFSKNKFEIYFTN